jgi:SWI/SNF-related matrix-associated actin-dependent regulator 1 of chromatin subfamily A
VSTTLPIHKILARFPGLCAGCKKTTRKGDAIAWDQTTRRVWHARCAPDQEECAAVAVDERAAAVVASRATDAEVDLPCPEGLSYLPYQRAGIAYALGRRAVLLADEMGLGKTIQAIGTINADRSVRRVIVVCPASLRANWQRELERWLVRPLSVGMGSAKHWPDTDVVICSWDAMRALRPEVDQVQWDLCVVDEAHRGKDPRAQRTKAVYGTESKKTKSGTAGIKARRRIALTGTPIPNRPREIWPTLRWLDPDHWGKFWPFALAYCNAHEGKFGWDFDGSSKLQELQERLRSTVMIRRLKKDVLTELPPKRRSILVIDPDDLDGTEATEARRAVSAERQAWESREQDVERLRAAAELAKAADSDADWQAAVAALSARVRVAFTEMAHVRLDTAVAKIPAVVSVLRDQLEGDQGKVVVFAHHHAVVQALTEGLAEFGVAVLTGETPMAARQEAVDRFQQDPKCRVFLGSITAAGVGLTLTAASRVVFAELDWVPGNVTQCEDRCHRIGQTDSVDVLHVVLRDSLDEKMAKTLVEKQRIADQALDAITTATQAASAPKDVIATEETSRERIAREALSMTPERITAVHKGLRVLAGMCDGASRIDGAGFSKIDAHLGHELARLEHFTPKQAALGMRMIVRYHRQLSAELVVAAKGVASA